MNTSLTKGQIQFIRELHQKEGRKLHGLYIVEGEKMVEELLVSGHKLQHLYHTADLDLPDTSNKFVRISSKDLERISALTTPNKVLAVVHIPDNVPPTSDKLIYCSGMQDPGNAGTILRIADWYGMNDVVFSANSVDVYSPKVVQASMGAIFRINCVYDEPGYEKMTELKQAGYFVYAADMKGVNINEVAFNEKAIILMGSESHGIASEMTLFINERITIPKIGKAESLNVGVACGIICNKIFFN